MRSLSIFSCASTNSPFHSDTRRIYERVCHDLAATYNRVLPKEVLIACGAMQTPEMAEHICRKLNLVIPWEAFLVQLTEYTCHLVANPEMMQGAERLVFNLASNCVGLALITSSTREDYKKKIRGREAFFDLFDHVLCSDEYNRHKPEPDCYLLAMSKFCAKPSPDCCLAFDGTVKGVQAARDARLQVVMLPDLDLPCCWSELATQRLETLDDFDPTDFGLPELPPLKLMPTGYSGTSLSSGTSKKSAKSNKSNKANKPDKSKKSK